MANKLPQAKIEEMWVAYQEKQSLRYVSQKCKVAIKTIRRYRSLEDWDGRLKKIRERAQKESDTLASKRMKEDLQITQLCKRNFLTALVGKVIQKCPHCKKNVEIQVPMLTAKTLKDIVPVIELERNLLGDAGFEEPEPRRIKFGIKPPTDD